MISLVPAVAVTLYPHVCSSLHYRSTSRAKPELRPSTPASHADQDSPAGPQHSKEHFAGFIAWCQSDLRSVGISITGRGFTPARPRRPVDPGHEFGVFFHVPFQGGCPGYRRFCLIVDRLLHHGIGSFASARPSRTLQGAGDQRRGAKPVAAACADPCQGQIPFARISPMTSAFLSRRGRRSGPSRRSAASCARALRNPAGDTSRILPDVDQVRCGCA